MKIEKFTRSITIAIILFTTQMVYSQTSKIQFIHNSSDYIIDTVDIWVNNVKKVDNLPFRKATQMLSIDSGYYDIIVAKKFSTDTSAAVTLFKLASYRIDTSKTYLAIVTGVVDTNVYASNPNGVNRSFNLVVFDTYKQTTAATKIELSFFNGSTDAPMLDFNKIGASATKIGDDIQYSTLTNSSVFTSGNLVFNLTSADSTKFKGAYKLNTSGYTGKVGVIFTSGVYDTTGNPTPTKTMKVFVAFSEGSVVELTKLTGDVQFIHSSADVTLDTVDVYINGVKTISKFAFRTATAYKTFDAMVPAYSIAIAPKGSISVADAFYTTTLAIDSNTNYYAIITGLKSQTGYLANPNAKNTDFKVYTYKGARKSALAAKNVDLLYFHGATDLRATTLLGVGQVQFLSKNDSYGDFHGYGAMSAVDNIRFDLKDAVADTIMRASWFANLAIHKGSAGIAFMSGFLADSTNHDGDTLVLLMAWPNGKVDSIAPVKPLTGLKELYNNTPAGFKVYPNPTNDVLNINFKAKDVNSADVSIYDITGKLVYSAPIIAKDGDNTVTIETNSINSSGLYFLCVRLNDQKINSRITIIK